MSIEKQTATFVDGITESGHLHVKTVTRLIENGVVLSENYHRNTLAPGDDLTAQPENVVAVARAVWIN